MSELDLKEIIWMLHQRIMRLEEKTEIKYSDFNKRSDEYIADILDSIKEGE